MQSVKEEITPWRVRCFGNCGNVCLTREQYMYQLSRPDSFWSCPQCYEQASWDDDWYEQKMEERDREYWSKIDETAIKFETESGSVYEVATEEDRLLEDYPNPPPEGVTIAGNIIRRLNGPNDPTPRQGQDGAWQSCKAVLHNGVGSNLAILWGSWRQRFESSPEDAEPTTITSPIVRELP